MGEWHIGVFGGSGLYQGAELEAAQEIAVRSPFGEPSGPVTTGWLDGVRFTFMARHGAGHRLPPGSINYRANIDVMKRCGVTDLLAISAVGSLREDMAPGDFVAVDQLIDRTTGRERSFFGPGCTAHVSLADPACPRLSALAADAARAAGARLHTGGTYIAIDGPQFSTRAESRLYRQWGADVIGMTAMPEAGLAREAELPYALLAMVTDYDCWRTEEPAVEVSTILEVMHRNAAVAKRILGQFAGRLPKDRVASPVDTTLDGALATPPESRDPQLMSILDAIAGRLLT